MDREYEEMIQKLDTFSAKAKDMKDFDEFMAKVDEIESIVKGFSSTDDKTVEQSLMRADKFLANQEIPTKSDPTDDDNGTTLKTKKTYNKTVINDKAFKEDDKKPKEMDPEEFMKTIEEDAKQRAEDRKKRKEMAGELKVRAESQFNSGDYNSALKTYDQAISTLKDWAALYTGRAQTHLQLGNVKEAMSDCNWAFKADEKSLNAHITQGKVFMATKDYNKAIEIFQKAIELKPNKKFFIEGYLNEAKSKAKKKKSTLKKTSCSE